MSNTHQVIAVVSNDSMKEVPCMNADCTLGSTITELQYQMELNHARIVADIASADSVETRLYKTEILTAMQREYVPVSQYGYESAVADIDAVKTEVARLIAEGTAEEGEAFIQARINSPEFLTLLSKRDAMKAMAEAISIDRKVLKNEFQKNPEFTYENVRQTELNLLDVHEEIIILKKQVNEYKDAHAPLINHLAEVEEERQRATGEWSEFEAETLNNLIKTAYFESGTREWLEQRQNGIGGSDVGDIIGVAGSFSNRAEVMDSKLNPISEEEVAEQALNQSEFAGALGRGNAWEKRIFLQLKDMFPQDNVTFCKTSWQNKHHLFQLANFDGLMTDANGHPDGIVEIKTGSDINKWGPVSAGLDGVPADYRAQVLWYAHAAGFKRGMVAVIIDDRELRVYRFNVTDEIEAEQKRNFELVEAFVNEWNARKAGTWVPPVKRQSRGFTQGALNSSVNNAHKHVLFKEIAAIRQSTVEEVKAEFLTSFADSADLKDQDKVREALKGLYFCTAKNYDLPAYVGVDLETSGGQPYKGRIIEFGATVRSGGQPNEIEETSKINQLYGLIRKSRMSLGVGIQGVHGISDTQISKKRSFNHEEESLRVLNLLKEYRIMLAHNAQFEENWLNTHVPGFADCVKNGDIVIMDSMKHSRWFFSDSTPNDKMESFTARFKVPYVDAHRAYKDARMMSIAWERMWDEWKRS